MDKSKAKGTGKRRLHTIQKKGKIQNIQLNKKQYTGLNEIMPTNQEKHARKASK